MTRRCVTSLDAFILEEFANCQAERQTEQERAQKLQAEHNATLSKAIIFLSLDDLAQCKQQVQTLQVQLHELTGTHTILYSLYLIEKCNNVEGELRVKKEQLQTAEATMVSLKRQHDRTALV